VAAHVRPAADHLDIVGRIVEALTEARQAKKR
jgi:hypothetical protein